MAVYLPTEQLRPFIKTYRIIESQDELVNRVLPETSLAIAFRYKGQVNYITDYAADNFQITRNSSVIQSLPVAAISGLRTSVRLINYLKDTATIIIIFKEGGASAFFKDPLHELFGKSVTLDNFISVQKISIVEEQLAEANHNDQRIAIIEDFLLSLYNPKTDKLISNAIQKIYSTNGLIQMKTLADHSCSSQDAFEKRFRKFIGTSPKQFSSIVRMKSVISNPERQIQNFTETAFKAGYFDQSHFNKDFKRFTGLSPTDFFKSSTYW
ncbi:helix-turn-helix domain-containing protein [Pedobacter metabolipauper]|nr:helix-turn-helix domain-containing protein [Pedobacter metabolipauper]